MSNHKETLERLELLFGEQIEAMVVGKHDGRRWDDESRPDENVVLDREAGLAKVDEEHDDGYGSADCYPFYAWTKSRVFFVHEYDGSTGVTWAPRHPMPIEPQFSGQ